MVALNDEMREIYENQPFIIAATINQDNGLPHMIVIADKWMVDNSTLAFGRWQMRKTAENLQKNNIVIVIAVDPEKNRSVRFFGDGSFKENKDLDLPDEASKFKEFLVVDIKRIQYGQWGKDTNVDFSYDETWK
ncbi:MAG: pyridoxamine 5'-phosphate oxidase family protein, partial [Candidatus Hodarchaeales archaeon]